MGFPGGNILGLALSVITPQQLSYRRFVSRAANAAGVWNVKYSNPVQLRGSIQPVPRERYEQNGLDFQKNYVTIFVSQNVIDISRDVTGDQFWYAGKLYQAESRTPWFQQDGWDAILCIEEPGCSPPFPAEG